MSDLLTRASQLIAAERREAYGDTFPVAASFWSAYLGVPITPEQVCLCMALLKLSRESNQHSEDNLIDAAGYIALADQQINKEEPC